MSHVRPRALDARRVRQLLSKTSEEDAGGRVGRLAELLLGRRYESNPLTGSVAAPEVFSASLDGFDCVTYVETVLALSRASGASAFAANLRRLRYEGGAVEWRRRNHYMTSWIRNNARAGFIRPLGAERLARRVERVLDAVPGLRPRRARFWCVPKRSIRRLEPSLATGDLIFFASAKPSLDVFHCGILVRAKDAVRMRHASRSRGSVVEQDLGAFLKENRMAGVMIARPVGAEPGA